MARFAVDAQKDVQFRNHTASLVQGVAPRDYTSELAALLNFVRLNVRYLRDPVQFERVQTPQVTLRIKSGDCDDMATLLAAMSTAIGHRSRFAAGAFGAGRQPTHVWCESYDSVSKCWLALDPVPGKRVAQMLGRTHDVIRVPVAVQNA